MMGMDRRVISKRLIELGCCALVAGVVLPLALGLMTDGISLIGYLERTMMGTQLIVPVMGVVFLVFGWFLRPRGDRGSSSTDKG
jgi:hypothetical protein